MLPERRSDPASYKKTLVHSEAAQPPEHPVLKQSLAVLSLAALGVVFGDIGTSPLYAIKTVFDPEHGLPLTPKNIVGIISLIFWSLMMVVSLKYVTLILRANNHGEGGVMALLALASMAVRRKPQLRHVLLLVGAFGAALFYGDSIITPAISVLSAVEGLEIATPVFRPYIVPIALVVLIALFLLQRWGTAGIGALFGPVMILWFGVLALIGIYNTLQAPEIFAALNPFEALDFALRNRWLAFIALGGVVLALTGGEALYADMGHFGAKAIRVAWFALVLPALALNYFGQGALLLTRPEAIANPFYLLFPPWALYPMVGLATAATVIASQAVISSAFSITKQAIQLGFLPRMQIIHTSAKAIGQIYLPKMNWALLAAVILVVIGFGSSSELAAAYGIAVTATMTIDTFLAFFVVRYTWRLHWGWAVLATTLFMTIDLTFFAATALKFFDGGWLPLLVGVVIFTIMVTWQRGRQILRRRLAQGSPVALKPFLESLLAHPPVRVEGTAVFMTADPERVPNALLHNLAHNKVLHERVVFLTVKVREVPWVAESERVGVEPLAPDCFLVTLSYGFQDEIDLPQALQCCSREGLTFEALETSYFLSREVAVPTPGKEGMALWRERLFATMSRNAGNVAEYFKLPANRVIELGTRIDI